MEAPAALKALACVLLIQVQPFLLSANTTAAALRAWQDTIAIAVQCSAG